MARPTRATSSKSSPASRTSTPRRPRQSSSVKSETPIARTSTRGQGRSNGKNESQSRGQGKTSPYFSKVATSSPLAKKPVTASRSAKGATASRTSKPIVKGRSRGKARAARGDDEDDGDEHEATGMTETEPSSDDSSDSGGSEDDFAPSDEDGQEEEEELDSDNLDDNDNGHDDDDDDDDDDFGATGSKRKAKRKSVGSGGGAAKKKVKVKPRDSMNGVRGRGKVVRLGSEEDDEDEVELEEGQEIKGRIYPAPKKGQVPPGMISQNTFDFLVNLQVPERNDREWFRSHEPAFRQAEKEWQAFVGLVQLKIHEADDEVPVLPPKDLIHRIYRDIRFSSDKTPYKKSFSLSTSRGGRKGIWAGYHLAISPNGNSILASGIWMPGKNEVASIRRQILTDPTRFRETISYPDFVRLFGPPKPHPKGKRQNVFGHEDALKVAPKGVDKEHKDIDLLKLRSVAVVHRFTDEQVLAEDFMDKVGEVAAVLRPFVRMLNDYMTIPPDADDDDNGDEV
ncbi:hypothetical protein JCM24511_05954 [Saitozyma sp. JCM 24511]|nr:hypothetical protein JCM24511_05954 [Saitozyma sp. JCM 24511]